MTLTVDIVSPEKPVYSQSQAVLVSAPAALGRIGVLPGHMPLISILEKGELRVEEAGGQTFRTIIRGGFIQIRDNRVLALVDASV